MAALKTNAIIQRISRLIYYRRGFFTRFLTSGNEVHESLFGKYRFAMDLSLGRLQKVFYLKPDTYEPDTQEALKSLVSPGMTVLDIGANCGYFSILMGDLVGPTGRVFSFEPYAPSFALLKENIESNPLQQVSIHPVALSDRAGEATLTVNPVNDGGHSLGDMRKNPELAGWDTEKLKRTVPTVTLDQFIERHRIDRVHVIKIDVEGAETLVFAGARGLLSRPDAPAIICEVSNAAQASVGKTEGDLRRMLYAFGYKSFWLGRDVKELKAETSFRGEANLLFKK